MIKKWFDTNELQKLIMFTFYLPFHLLIYRHSSSLLPITIYFFFDKIIIRNSLSGHWICYRRLLILHCRRNKYVISEVSTAFFHTLITKCVCNLVCMFTFWLFFFIYNNAFSLFLIFRN